MSLYRDAAQKEQFLFSAFKDSSYLEDVSGLKQLHADTIKSLENIDWLDDADNDGFDDEDVGGDADAAGNDQ